MAYTRVQFEKTLVKRAGRLMIQAGMDGTTITGVNPDLDDPIATALRQSGMAVADITLPADADIAGVGDVLLDQVLDLAELRLYLNMRGNYNKVNIRVGPRSTDYSQLRDTLKQRIDELSARVAMVYGIGAQGLTAGTLTNEFMESGASEDDE